VTTMLVTTMLLTTMLLTTWWTARGRDAWRSLRRSSPAVPAAP
jgi:hypothetical protein